jgi:uncharacterized membrane protein
MSDGKQSSDSPPPNNALEKEQVVALEKIITEKEPGVFNGLPQDKRDRIVRVIMQQVSMRSGPLPDPSELAQYQAIIPNGADRIMKMAESQLEHRIKIETTVIGSQQRQAGFGQVCALVIAIVALTLATYAAVNGQPVFGGVIGGTTLVSLVSAFLVSTHKKKAEAQEDKNQPPQKIKKKNR